MAQWIYSTFKSDIDISHRKGTDNGTADIPSVLYCAVQHSNINGAKWVISLPIFKGPEKAAPGDIVGCLSFALRNGRSDLVNLIIELIKSSDFDLTKVHNDCFADACWGGSLDNVKIMNDILEVTQTSYDYGFIAAVWNYHVPILAWLHEGGKIDIRRHNDMAFRELFNNRTKAIYTRDEDNNTKLLETAQWFCTVCPSYHIVLEDDKIVSYVIDIIVPERDICGEYDHIDCNEGATESVAVAKDMEACCIS